MATTPAKRACSVCGTLLADDGTFCPVCAFQQALGTQTYSDSKPSSELRFDHYTVLQNAEGKPFELGRGGMGVTYKAFDVHLQRPAALKIINAQLLGNESARARFIREARAAASIRHQNVASVFHIGESGGNYYYAMEFVEGESLQSLIRRSGRLGIVLAFDILEQVAAGLTAIQKQDLVHRDIKPSNIMVPCQDGKLENVKIIDLGLAKGVAEENTLSTVGAFVGTPAYASPEQFAGITTDIRSDLYSLGVTLWEMLSGKVPFTGSAAELMYQHQHAQPPIEKLRNVTAPVIALLQVLLAKDPNQRFQTPAQLQHAVATVREAIGSGQKVTADNLRLAGDQPTKDLSKAKTRKQRVRWLQGAGACLAIALITWFFASGHLGLFNQRVTEAASTEKSIAVLPFDNISPNKENAYFADGVQDEILNNLAKVAQLKVISRTSVMQYRAEAKRNLRQIAADLGVANVLEGTVRREANHVRVSTELVNAQNDNTIWADSYDRDLTDIFAIQSDIAQQVASRLRAELSPEERKEIHEKPTDNLEAYDLYLRAKQLVTRVSAISLPSNEQKNLAEAINLLTEATRKDPNFAIGYCLIAKAHDLLYFDLVDHTPERRALGDAAVQEALRLRPDLPEAHFAAALHYYACYQDLESARTHISIAAKFSPNDPDLLRVMSIIDQAQGRWEQATKALEKAVNLDPRNPELLESLADQYSNLRRFRDSDRIRDRLIELEPDEPLFVLNKADARFCEQGHLKSVRDLYEALPSPMKDDVRIRNQRWYYAMCARDYKAAREIVDNSPNEDISMAFVTVPRRCADIWLDFIQGNHPKMEEFRATREQLYKQIDADPTNALLLSVVATIDLALGHNAEAILGAKRATEMMPISKDAMIGPLLVKNLALVYAWAGEWNLAFEQLDILVKRPNNSFLNYGDLKFDPAWDPLRKDPRFDKLLAELAPRD